MSSIDLQSVQTQSNRHKPTYQEIDVTNTAIQPTQNIHPMVTRTKDSTFKPKVLSTTHHPLPLVLTTLKSTLEPTYYSIAVKILG